MKKILILMLAALMGCALSGCKIKPKPDPLYYWWHIVSEQEYEVPEAIDALHFFDKEKCEIGFVNADYISGRYTRNKDTIHIKTKYGHPFSNMVFEYKFHDHYMDVVFKDIDGKSYPKTYRFYERVSYNDEE